MVVQSAEFVSLFLLRVLQEEGCDAMLNDIQIEADTNDALIQR